MVQTIDSSAHVEREGVYETGKIVHKRLEWIFREQPLVDYGIDAQIEVVDRKTVTGKLIAVQIKSGSSYFKPAPSGWWFYLDSSHVEYWLKHALPVIVVIYDPQTEKAYWESVEPANIRPTRKGGQKLLIPESNELSKESKTELTRLADGNPYELRIRQLRLALPWMKLLKSGRRLLLEAQEWINKTSGRGELTVISVDDANENPEELGEWHVFAGLAPYEEVLPRLVPWADVVLHEETYDEADCEEWEAECVTYDNESDRFVRESYEEWHAKFDDVGLRPYRNGAGEVDFWRLEMVLNDLGRGFLLVDEFAESNGWFLTPRKH